uniref:Helicase-associated domain-containing protein n=1 Tax=Entomoneis paludosa TaxID=265537 RepID=A0A7S2Y8D8_9STRA|mmetsp:Transcript_22180/g.46255  ORF Transcript_22180/g.46255 Transcript_22180/m.46255 type:complete len:340 (+) Transcript_22180:71-1090(+)
MNQLFTNPMLSAAANMGMPYGAAAPVKKEKMNQAANSLFAMAMYDMPSQQQNANAPALPSAPSHFYPVEEYKDLSLREILDLSEDCLFSDDEDSAPVIAPLRAPSAPMSSCAAPVAPSSSIMSKEDIEWNQLEDLPISPMEDIPVAAALVGSMDATANRKRSRDCEFEQDEDSEDMEDRRFRPYQTGQWAEKFEELCIYRKINGHCLVPHTFRENLPLARWVKRQRYQYKLMKEGKSSTMTEDRVQALEEIGFIWDSQGAAWSERLEELRSYRGQFGHCNVPSNYSENPQLATWVKCQRRQYKLYQEQKPSNMTAERITELGALGFEWELRSYKKARTC